MTSQRRDGNGTAQLCTDRGSTARVLRALGGVLGLLLVASTARGQGDTGFLRGAGNLDLALSYSLDTYDEFWVGDSKVENPPFGRIKRHTGNIYLAYGVTDDMDLTANASYVVAEAENNVPGIDDEDAFQDLVVQAKIRLHSWSLGDGTLSVLAAPGVKMPLSNYQDDNVTAVGDGQIDLRLRAIAQYLLPSGLFFAVETGYDFRGEDPPDEIPLHLSLGATFGPATVTGFYSLIEADGGYDISDVGPGMPFPGVEEEYERVGVSLYWRLNDCLGLTAAAWTTLDGKNTGDVDGFSVGTVLRF